MIKPTNDKKFEEMVRDCASELYAGIYDLYGRNGQEQHGCDVFSTDFKIIIQCKCYNENNRDSYRRFSERIKDDFEKADAHFEQMERFVVVTTLDRDSETQEELYKLDKGRVKIVFWEDFEKAYATYEEKYRPKEVRDTLRETLLRDRDAHPSFQLMKADEIDKSLFTDFKDVIAFPSMATSGINGPISPIWDYIRKDHENGSCRSVVIEGTGGIGKTVALFSLADDGDERHVPAIYVPMYQLRTEDKNCVYHYIKQKFPYLHDAIEALAQTPRADGPGLILLLDGFNEIPADHRRKVLEQVNDWRMAHEGVQLVAVSRPLDTVNLKTELAGSPLYIELQPLTKETACDFILKHKLEPPASSAPVWNILVYPLFLVLYVKTGILQGQSNAGYALAPKDANGGGAIIWNFLQRELMKIPNSEDWVIHCAVVCEWVLPYIAYRMEQESSFTVNIDSANMWIDQAIDNLQAHIPNQLPNHLKAIFDTYQWNNLEFPDLAVYGKKEWHKLVLRDCGVLVGSGKRGKQGGFAFLHQNFRDCLVAIYLVNQAEIIHKKTLPAVWRAGVTPYVLGYAAELMDRDTAKNLWEANRLLHPLDRIATYTQLELQVQRKPAQRITLDFSDMDLRGLSLTRYCSRRSTFLSIFRNPVLSKNTLLDERTFQSVGHTNRITSVAAMPNGCCLSGSDDNTLRVWDVDTGECLQTLVQQTDWINCIAILTNGRCISESRNHTLYVWDINTGECIQTLRGHNRFVTCAAMLPDGRYVSGSNDHTLRVWDADTGECLRTLEGHTDWVRCVGALPDGHCVSGSDDKTLRVWDVDTGECLHVLEGHNDYVTCITVLQNGHCISGASDGKLRVWDTNTGECLQIFKENIRKVTCIATLPGGRCVTGSGNGILQIWNICARKCLLSLRGHSSSINCVAALADGRCITGSDDNTLRIWDSVTGKLLRHMGLSSIAPVCIAVLQNGCHISLSADGTIRLWNTESGTLLKTLPRYPGFIKCIAALPDERCVTGSRNGILRIWNVNTEECHSLQGSNRAVICIAALSNGNYVSGLWDNTLRVRNADTGKRLQTLRGHTKPVTCIATLPNGLCVSGSDDHTLRLWNVDTGECLRILRGYTRKITCVAALSNARCVSSGDETLWVWDFATKTRLQVLRGHTDFVTCVAALSDRRCVSGSNDKTLRVWDVDTGECLHILEGHTNCVNCVVTLPDGKILSGAADNTLRIWDLDTGECLRVSELLEPDVCGMDLSLAKPTPSLARKLLTNGVKTLNH